MNGKIDIFNYPIELQIYILSFLYPEEIGVLSTCSKKIYKICNFEDLWEDFCKRRFPIDYEKNIINNNEEKILYKKLFFKFVNKWIIEKSKLKGVGQKDIFKAVKNLPFKCTQPLEQLTVMSGKHNIYDEGKIIYCDLKQFKKWINEINVNYYIPKSSHCFPPSCTSLLAFCHNAYTDMDKNWDKITYLVEELNADVNFKDLTGYEMSPLLASANSNHIKLVGYLLSMGAKITDKDKRGKGIFEMSTIEIATIITDFCIENKMISLPQYYYGEVIKGIIESSQSWVRFIPSEKKRNVFISIIEKNSGVKPKKGKNVVLKCDNPEKSKTVKVTSNYFYASNSVKADVWTLKFKDGIFTYKYIDANYHTWNKTITYTGEEFFFNFLKSIGLENSDAVPFLIFLFSYTDMYLELNKRENLMNSEQFTGSKLPAEPSWFKKTKYSWIKIEFVKTHAIKSNYNLNIWKKNDSIPFSEKIGEIVKKIDNHCSIL